jgi:hypothetical protein
MHHTELASALIVAAIAVNLPFGAWRVTVPRFSLRWFLAVHLPIPVVFILRTAFGFSAWYIPVMLACAVTGQLLGSWLYHSWRSRHAVAPAETD